MQILIQAPDRLCNFSWTAVAALAAVATAVIIFFQVRQEARLNRLTMGVDSLLRLSEDWNSPRMTRIRRLAAKALLDGNPDANVDTVLDWFETVALMVRRGGFDEEFTWHTFYVWMAHYWVAGQDYIRDTQADEGEITWGDFSKLMPRLFAREAGSEKWTPAEVYPSMGDVQTFLEDEAQLEGGGAN
jgi:hypothetical protein